MKIEEIACLLVYPWKRTLDGDPDDPDTKILGQWAEDASGYHMYVPSQLRDPLIKLQNHLCRKYNELEDLKMLVGNEEAKLREFLE